MAEPPKEDSMSETKRMKKAIEIARKLMNEEETSVDAMTIITMAAGLLLRSIAPPEDFIKTADLYSQLIKMTPLKLPEGLTQETTH